ncbi:MAG: mechanosensitive ion channel family protein [Dehalococcoidia bacterium]
MILAQIFLIPSTGEEWQDWLGANGVNIIGILIGLIIVRILVTRIIGRVIRTAAMRAGRARLDDEALVKRRVDTLISTLTWMFTIFLLLVGSALILDQFDVQISALIAGVGVIGIAVGLGAQTLIKDVINGMFILVEGQYAVGDVVRVADVSGSVIEITPRRTVLRDLDGNVHVIPNSSITIATNMTQGFSRINLNIGIAYEENIDKVLRVIREVCDQLAEDRPNDIISAPAPIRVDALGGDSVDIKIVGDVKVFTQWELTGELRKRLKDRFDAEGIEIPYHREVQVPYRGGALPTTGVEALQSVRPEDETSS